MSRPSPQHAPDPVGSVSDEFDAASVPAPRFEWVPPGPRPTAGVSFADVSDFPTTEIPRIID